jgi:hypothetical protein
MVTHASLTGSDLHEPKGIENATAGQVYVADGAGSGDWTTTSSDNAFSNAFAHYREQQSSGVSSNLTTSNSWTLVPLNTEVFDNIGLTLASNAIALPSGTYHVKATVPLNMSSSPRLAKARIYNITDGASLIVGPAIRGQQTTVSSLSSGGQTISNTVTNEDTVSVSLEGRFTLGASKTVGLQVITSASTAKFPPFTASGVEEVYSELYIWKIA